MLIGVPGGGCVIVVGTADRPGAEVGIPEANGITEPIFPDAAAPEATGPAVTGVLVCAGVAPCVTGTALACNGVETGAAGGTPRAETSAQCQSFA